MRMSGRNYPYQVPGTVYLYCTRYRTRRLKHLVGLQSPVSAPAWVSERKLGGVHAPEREVRSKDSLVAAGAIRSERVVCSPARPTGVHYSRGFGHPTTD